MAFKEFHCPSCGAPVELEYRFTETVVCPYCNQTVHWTGENFEAKGEKVILSDYGSKFSVGLKASFWVNNDEGKRVTYNFKILGRVRFEYTDGFWDEWLMRVEGTDEEYWLQEDEGELVIFKKAKILPEIIDYDQLKVGMHVKAGDYTVFISEKSKAQVIGGEGELPFRIIPGEQADFVDGIIYGHGIPTSLEFLPDNQKAFYYADFNTLEGIGSFIFTENKKENVY